jgi:AcrR family transcriptional regulator
MARSRGYDREAVLAAARDLFWERGFDATSITDLEQRTGLNRSSLYQEFGSKDALFESALSCYADQVVARLFDPVRSANAGLVEVAQLFTRLGGLLRCDPATYGRGCLLVNTGTELSSIPPGARQAVAAYRDGVRGDFLAALTRSAARGETDPADVKSRSYLLASTLMGIWLHARIDPQDAADLCDMLAHDISGWRVDARPASPA